VFTAPGEGQQKDFMELGEASLAADQEVPPNQRAHISKHHSELIKFCHWSSLPNIPRKTLHKTPGFFRSPYTTQGVSDNRKGGKSERVCPVARMGSSKC
jgi:hypothetical protein